MLAALVAVQAGVLVQNPLVFTNADSPSYLRSAHSIASGTGMFDPDRPPGLGALVALVQAFAGSGLEPVVVVQALLLSLAAIELYVVAYLVCGSVRWGALAAVLGGANFYVLQWERVITSEALAIVLLVSTVLVLALDLRRPRAAWLVLLGVLGLACVLTKPLLLPLPGVVLLFSALRRGYPPSPPPASPAPPRQAGRFFLPLLVGAVLYGTVYAYAVGNDRAFPGAGLSDTVNVNLFGKVIEYGIQDGAAGYPDLVRVAADFHRRGEIDAYAAGVANPEAVGRYYARAAGFAREAILADGPRFALDTAGDSGVIWLAAPLTMGLPQSPPWLTAVRLASLPGYLAYPLLPVAAWVAARRWWRRRDDVAALLALALVALMAAHGVTMAATCYDWFGRLRSTVDPLALALVPAILPWALATLRRGEAGLPR